MSERIILNANDHMLALRAAKYLLAQPAEKRDAILCYGENHRLCFYAQRTKTGVSCRQLPDAPL